MYVLDDGSVFIECPEDFDKAELKYGQRFSIKCIKCGNEQTRRFKGIEIINYKTMKCGKCLKGEHISATKKNWTPEQKQQMVEKRKATCLADYGYENNSQRPEARQKMREHWADKSPEEKERWRQQSVNFWKNASDEEIKEYVLRNKASKLRNHGDENYNNAEKISETKRNWSDEQLQQMLDRKCATNLELHGDEYYNNSKQMSETKKNWSPEQKRQMLDRLHASNFEKLGVENSMQCPEIVQKVVNAWHNKTPEEKDFIRNKVKESLFKTTGCTHPIVGKYYFYGLRFDSSWELAVWIYCIDRNIGINRIPKTFKFIDMNGKIRDYIPDFLINGKLVEVKGDLFFKEDGTMYYPYTKKKVNGEWVPLTPEEKAYYDDLYERKHQCGLEHGVEFWRESECQPYIDYCNSRYPGWHVLFRKDNPLNPSYWCFSFVNPGHIQPIYYVPAITPSVSPFDKPDTDGFVVKGHGISPYDIPRQ